MKHFGRVVITCLVVLICPRYIHAQAKEEVVKGAKKEGKLIYYSALTVREGLELAAAFEKKYPFIKTEIFRLGADKMRTRILIEARAGRHLFDVTSFNVVDIGILQHAGILGKYRSKETEAIPKGLRDEQGFWTAIYMRQFVLTYHSWMIAKTEAPKDWWDLLDPKWKGKLGMDRDDIEWYAALAIHWGREKARKLLRGFASQKPVINRGHNLIAQLNIAGEFPLSIGYGHQILAMKEKGAPLDFVDTTDPVVTSPTVIALSANAPNPNAAQLFADFVLSLEGQTILKGFDRVTSRADVSPRSPRLNPQKLKSLFVSPQIFDRYEEYQTEYYEILGISRR